MIIYNDVAAWLSSFILAPNDMLFYSPSPQTDAKGEKLGIWKLVKWKLQLHWFTGQLLENFAKFPSSNRAAAFKSYLLCALVIYYLILRISKLLP